MYINNILLTSAFLSAATSTATPVTVRSTPCNPNFEGAGIIFHGIDIAITGYGAADSDKPAWHIQQNGQSYPSYIFRSIYNSSQVLTESFRGFIWLDTASDSGNDPLQLFDIVCDTCVGGASSLPQGSTVAAGCRVRAPGYPNVCVEASGASIRYLGCTGWPNQDFWFST